jgi:hypothetical protein
VNHSPSFFTDSAIDHAVKAALLREVFRVAGSTLQDKKSFLAEQQAKAQQRLCGAVWGGDDEGRADAGEEGEGEGEGEGENWFSGGSGGGAGGGGGGAGRGGTASVRGGSFRSGSGRGSCLQVGGTPAALQPANRKGSTDQQRSRAVPCSALKPTNRREWSACSACARSLLRTLTTL